MSELEKIKLLRVPSHCKVMYAFRKSPNKKVVWVCTEYIAKNSFINTHAIKTYAKRIGDGEMDYDILCEKIVL